MKSDSTLHSLQYSKTKSFLLGVASGKFSEGVEIVRNGGSMISTVVFAGLPFQRKSNDEGIIKGAIAKAAKDERAAQQFMRTIPLSRTVQQAFGRTVRQHLDKGALVILDYRAEKDLREELGLIKFISIEDVKSRLGVFFEGYSNLTDV